MPAGLRVEDLTVALDGTRRARCSFMLAPGERCALTGPSGSGKTTLLRGIAQLVAPVSGTVRLDDQTPEALGYPAFRRRVVYVGQRPALTAATVRANLEAAFSYRSASKPFVLEEARTCLEALRLPDVLDRAARELSVGEQQRVAFVRAFLLAPDVFLLDEPTSALDPDAEAALETLLDADRDRRKSSAVIVTHQAAQAERLGAVRVEVA
ncbi:MAG: ABC transporter ATP-binding protein [Deltaproteobacteria bacterium]